MKKTFLLIVVSMFCFSVVFAHNDLMEPSGRTPITFHNSNWKYVNEIDASKSNYEMPEWEWVTEPYSFMTSWYDYMPSSYYGYPLRLQHNGDGGLYYTWHALPDDQQGTNRRQYWAYINADDGSLVDWGTISTEDIWQGYGSINIHPESGRGIASWHQNDDVLGYGTTMTDDSYIFGNPGFWATYLFIPPDEPGGNEYIWPYVWVGSSPETGKVRVYQTAKNYKYNSFGSPSEDKRIMYCDVDNSASADLSPLLDLDNWTEHTPMYYWREKDCRPLSQCFIVDPFDSAHVSIVGYATWLSGDQGDMPINQGIYKWDSYDHGQTWDQADLHDSGTPTDYFYKVDNVPDMMVDDTVHVDSLWVTSTGWHSNAIYDSEGNIHWYTLAEYMRLSQDDPDYYYRLNFHPTIEVVWDGDEFHYNEVPEMFGYDEASGHTVPWKIDPVTGDTLYSYTEAWSRYNLDGDAPIFNQHAIRTATNLEREWIVNIWPDATYDFLYDETGDDDYADYDDHPIFYMSASADNGEHWSEPVKLTDVLDSLGNPTQFSDQVTVFPYVCDEIVDIDGDWGKVYLVYFDDNSFGSYAGGMIAGQNNGGQMMFSSLKVNFAAMDTIPNAVDYQPDHDIASFISLKNSPNPFNNETTISFSAPRDIKNAEVKIYNTKGQLVKSLEPGTNNSVTWDGRDRNNSKVSNGIYFYKLVTEYGSVSRKMLLTR